MHWRVAATIIQVSQALIQLQLILNELDVADLIMTSFVDLGSLHALVKAEMSVAIH